MISEKMSKKLTCTILIFVLRLKICIMNFLFSEEFNPLEAHRIEIGSKTLLHIKSCLKIHQKVLRKKLFVRRFEYFMLNGTGKLWMKNIMKALVPNKVWHMACFAFQANINHFVLRIIKHSNVKIL
ncbi:hypothetical protein ACKWTF_000195 [Chironomus riparius]